MSFNLALMLYDEDLSSYATGQTGDRSRRRLSTHINRDPLLSRTAETQGWNMWKQEPS